MGQFQERHPNDATVTQAWLSFGVFFYLHCLFAPLSQPDKGDKAPCVRWYRNREGQDSPCPREFIVCSKSRDRSWSQAEGVPGGDARAELDPAHHLPRCHCCQKLCHWPKMQFNF